MGLVMLDSGDRIFDKNGGSLGYDYIRDDQVEWYAKQIGLLQGQYGADAKTLMFFHIPLQEYQTAWDTGTPVFGTKRADAQRHLFKGIGIKKYGGDVLRT